jgi:hypothetical protein
MRVVTSQIAIKIYGFEILVPPLEDPKKIFLFQIFFFIYSEVHLIQMWVQIDEIKSLDIILKRSSASFYAFHQI